MVEARRLHSIRPDGNPQFIASSGWLRRFMKRKKISMRNDRTVNSHGIRGKGIVIHHADQAAVNDAPLQRKMYSSYG